MKGALGAFIVGVLVLVGLAVSREPALTPATPALPPGATSSAAPVAEPIPPEPAAQVQPATPSPPPEAPPTEEPSPADKARTALENGLFWTSRGDDNRAVGWLQECLGHDSASSRCHLELGRLYARRGAVKDAVRHFTHHLALEREGPTATEARNYLNLYASTPAP
jgi:hypothetical protein